MKQFLFLCIVISIFLNQKIEPVQADTTLNLEVAISNLSSPLYLCSPPNNNRLFVVEQRGRIIISQNGTKLATPFLDISSIVLSGGELGLLGLAFHPDYVNNGFFYVNYTISINNQTNSRICRFTVDSTNQNIADPLSEVLLIQLKQPFDNHNGGMLTFGPDGYLYIGFGDGGSGGDPQNNSQNGNTFLGKMLRIDIDGAFPYTIPNDNPFVGDTTFLDEIWAYGLRNPWRYSFDRLNGNLIIADVGQNAIEEIDIQLSSSQGGENYGWRLKEGTVCFNPSINCEDGVTLTEPFYEYTHANFDCSVTGGYVYRGSCLPEFDGMYFYADLCTGNIWSFRDSSGVLIDSTKYTPTISVGLIASFGEDSNGELYIVNLNGTVYRIVPTGGSSQCNASGCCQGIRGNIDGDILDQIDISDLVFLVAFMFQKGSDPICLDEANVNASGGIDISDLVALVDFMYRGGIDPATCS